jgi:hypothetical protein
MGDRAHLRDQGDITEPESRMKSFREARVQHSFERPSLSTKAERSLNYQLRRTRLPWSKALSLKREPTKRKTPWPRKLDGCFRGGRRQMGDRPLPLLLGKERELENGVSASGSAVYSAVPNGKDQEFDGRVGRPKITEPKAKQPSPREPGCLLIVVSAVD